MLYSDVINRILSEVKRFVVGKSGVIEMLLVALISEGHVLLEGPPGVAKTLMAKTFASAIGAKFSRIQMTPDTLPADILGTMVYNVKDGTFYLKKGPIFSNIILVDELNRAPPKTQAAFIEAMQERQVTIEGVTYPLESPFLVIATQLPYGSPGTYPLTEVQMDRIAYKIKVGHPTPDEEVEIISKVDYIESERVRQVASVDEVLKLVSLAKEVYVSDAVKRYIVDIVNRLRNNHALEEGPSARGSIWMMKASRAYALIKGRDYVIPDDVKFVAPYVLRHRVVLKKGLVEEGIDEERIIKEVLEETPVPKE